MANALDIIHGTGKTIGYVRVSSVDQNTERQLDGVQLDKVFIDRASGGSKERPQLEALLSYVREDDTVVVHSMDRLARNVTDLRYIVERIVESGATIKFLKEGLSFSESNGRNPFDQLMLTVLGAFAEFERAMIAERRNEGIAIAKKKGVYKGRQHTLTDAQAKEMCDLVLSGVPKTVAGAKFGLSRWSVNHYMELLHPKEGRKHDSKDQPANA